MTPAKSRPWSPWIRLGLLGIFMLTLSSPWGESSSCKGPSHVYTGYEQLQKNSNGPYVLILIFLVPVFCGFLQFLARAAWVRMTFEFMAAIFASIGSLYCLLSAVIGGDWHTSSLRTYPAPWIATVTQVLTALDAYWGAFRQIHAIFWSGRSSRKVEPKPPEHPSAT